MMPCSCGKNVRQRLYCHRVDCASMAAVDLPPPTVDVTPAKERDPSAKDTAHDVVIHRGEGACRSYRIDGGSPRDLLKNGIEKVINDHYSGEWIPKG